MRARLGCALVLASMVAVAAEPAAAQEPVEMERVRAAADRESAGDLQGAEAILEDVLDERPTFVPAILALDRVLRIQGRREELVPRLETAVGRAPRSVLLNQLRVQLYADLDRVEELERAAREWRLMAPGSAVPYREIAEVWQTRGELGRALDVLRTGRRVLGRADVLALPMGDVLAAMQEYRAAAVEWGRSIEGQGRGVEEVRRRLREHPDVQPYASELIDAVVADRPGRPTPRQLEAALTLAQDAGLARRVRALGERLLPMLDSAQRWLLLERMARRAEGDGDHALAFWAYDRMLSWAADRYAQPDARRDPRLGMERLLWIRNRRAELALVLGDSAPALRERALDGAATGTDTRATAALRIELAADRDIDGAVKSLERFRAEHGDAPEVDRAAAPVAAALIRADRAPEAEALLTTVEGPHTATLQARLLLARGAVDSARAAYMQAVPELRGAPATRALERVALLDRVSPSTAALIGEAVRLEAEDRPEEAVHRLMDGLAEERVRSADVPAVLGQAARLADAAGLTERANDARRRIVADHPESPEAPAALLMLGRALGDAEATHPEARGYLERLILEYPESALVPQARRALERIGP